MSKIQWAPDATVTVSNKVLRDAVRALDAAEDAGFKDCRVEFYVWGFLGKTFKVFIASGRKNKELGIYDENVSSYHARKLGFGELEPVQKSEIKGYSLAELGMRIKQAFRG